MTGKDGAGVGILHAGFDVSYLSGLRLDILIDTAAIVFAVLLLAAELLILVFAFAVQRPARAADFMQGRPHRRDLRWMAPAGAMTRTLSAATSSIRALAGTVIRSPESGQAPKEVTLPSTASICLPLFLFFLSEAMLRPVLPAFLAGFTETPASGGFGAGMMMAAFMAASLVSVPAGSLLSERIAPKYIFLAGAALAGAGMAGHAAAVIPKPSCALWGATAASCRSWWTRSGISVPISSIPGEPRSRWESPDAIRA